MSSVTIVLTIRAVFSLSSDDMKRYSMKLTTCIPSMGPLTASRNENEGLYDGKISIK